MSFRKEKKYKVEHHTLMDLQIRMIGAGMKRLHPDREITSLYLDNSSMEMFHDSEEGVFPRKKIRIRWYNDDVRYKTKEIKISSFEGRFKYIEKLPTEIGSSPFKFTDSDYGHLKPVVKITYKRSYFEFKKLRITFDSMIKYQHPNQNNPAVFTDPNNVIEIKAPPNCGDDYIQNIISNPTERFSKYCRSVIFLNLA